MYFIDIWTLKETKPINQINSFTYPKKSLEGMKIGETKKTQLQYATMHFD